FGNLLQGVPFELDGFMRSTYTGSFWGLLNPFGLLAGVVSLSMLVMHGALYLQLRTEGELNARAAKAARWFGALFMAAFALAGVWQAAGIEGFRIVAMPDPGGVVSPLSKTVEMVEGAWMQNYTTRPWTMSAPIVAFAGGLLALLFSAAKRSGLAFVCSGAAVAGVIMTAALAMFPFIMPSSTQPNVSLTAYDAVSSHLTLNLMFIAVVVFLPIVLLYTSWVYSVLRGKLSEDKIRKETHTAY
ncbi:MAG: cytochrome d ubiquinol oxidase subunit II, partial [Desulfobacterales bacterium]